LSPTSFPFILPKQNPTIVTEFANKKVVLVAVPGAFTPTCQEQHVTSYLANLAQFRAKGVDSILFIASNDAFVMSAWGKANGVKDESIVRLLSLPLSLIFMERVCINTVKTALPVGHRPGIQQEHWLG
jgi:peroxiredoxin